MKTTRFNNNYQTIKYFCANANSGFCVVELNDMITKNEFINCLLNDFDVLVCSISDVISDNNKKNTDNTDCQIIVIDELNNDNLDQLAIDLNYERNKLSSLKKPIVFILSTSSVSKLINYSASFWSYVSLHKFFGNRFRNIFEPHFISSNNDVNLNGVLQTEFSSRLQVANSKRIQISSIINSVFNIDDSNLDIKSFLINQFSKLDKTNKKEVESFGYKILSLIERLQLSGFFLEAEECIKFFYYYFDPSKYPFEVITRLLRNSAEIKYKTKKYDEALKYYERLYEHLNGPTAISNNDYSVLMNNIGVVYYKEKRYDEALDCFYAGVNYVNYSKKNYPLIHILYNLSLLHWTINDVGNAFDYIESAIRIARNETNYYNLIFVSVFSVFYSYLQINCGEKDKAKQKLVDALDFFRNTLTEKCVSAMETHYVFAIFYFYSNELDNAYNCAKKAYYIAKRINVDLWIRVQLRELLGEICFYSNKYYEAHKFFSTCINYAEKHNLFSFEVLSWIKEVNEKCIACL